MTEPKPLNAKQLRFVDEYLIDLNATQAAIRAGYSAKTAQQIGSENLLKPVIAAEIRSRQQVRAAKSELDEAWVLDRLRENCERALQAVPVLDSEGGPTGEYRYEGSVVNRAVELIGKHRGMFAEKIDHRHKVSGGITVRIVREGRRTTAG